MRHADIGISSGGRVAEQRFDLSPRGVGSHLMCVVHSDPSKNLGVPCSTPNTSDQRLLHLDLDVPTAAHSGPCDGLGNPLMEENGLSPSSSSTAIGTIGVFVKIGEQSLSVSIRRRRAGEDVRADSAAHLKVEQDVASRRNDVANQSQPPRQAPVEKPTSLHC